MTARDAVYDTLRRRLTTGHYPPDAPLIPLALSAEFDVSRTPVREALALLERDGLLVPDRRGYRIRRRSDEELLEIFEVRAILDSSAAAAAATRRGPIDLAKLDELSARAEAATDPEQIRRALNQWHDAVRHAAHNTTISALLHTLDAQAKTSAPWNTSPATGAFTTTHEEHRAILAAIRSGDAETARVRMAEHHAHDRDTRIQQLAALQGRSGTTPGSG